MKILVISALAILVLLVVMPSTMASQGYWTPSDSSPPEGLKKYHIFLGETFPSSAFRVAKLVNENLTACLDFSHNSGKPLVCHPIKESDIPLTNYSIMDAGYFVVSNKLNDSDAVACVAIGYRHMDSCWSGRIESKNPYEIKLYYDMDRLIYDDVSAYDACLNDNHLKEGTKELDQCVSDLS